MVAITVHVVTQHDTDMNSHHVDGVFTTQQLALDNVVQWFNDARIDEGAPGIRSVDDLEVHQVADGLIDISDPHFEDLVFSITKTALQEA
jgi:hypothetical protein